MSRKFHFFGLRFKLLLLSGFLFSIPWLGYEYVWEMEKYLRAGQERTLLGTVRAVATALHERPKLFDAQALKKVGISMLIPSLILFVWMAICLTGVSSSTLCNMARTM